MFKKRAVNKEDRNNQYHIFCAVNERFERRNENRIVNRRVVLFILGTLLVIFLSGCSIKEKDFKVEPIVPEINIPPKNKTELKQPINQILTTEKKMALTFNGLSDEETMQRLLRELDRFDIKATFFLPGTRVAEDPELASVILKRGHTIQNNTLNHVLPDNLDYEEAYVEIFLANQIFEEYLDVHPTYVRSRSGDSSFAFEEAATALDMQVVSNTIYPKDSQMQSAEEIAAYVKKYSTRGSIIELNTYINPKIIDAIELIYKDAIESGYVLTTIEEMQQGSYHVENQPPTNNLVVNDEYEKAEPKIIKKFMTNKKEIALTFDDWASDETISAVLDILDTYDIQSSFFLIGNGVEKNPQLARLIIERGHEVANHSYTHKVVTTMESNELQEDLVKNDEILSYALQEKPHNYFRPAQGLIDEKTAKIISATGIDYIILYDVASLDWDLTLPEDEVFARVVNRVEPGSIIDMHILDDSHVLNVLPRIIEYLLDEGYVFRKISDMIEEEKAEL